MMRVENRQRTIATVVGTLFLAGMVVGVIGNMLIQSILSQPDYLSVISGNRMKLATGAILLLLTVAGDAAHGIIMLPVLKPHNTLMAFGYFGFRIVNAVFLGVQVLLVLLLIPIGHEYLKAGTAVDVLQSLANVAIQANVYSYQLAMIFVGAACLMLCYTLYMAKLLPRPLAVWGLVGYATILCGSVLEVLGFNMHLIHTIPGGLWEVFTGVWLIARGFSSPSIAVDSGKTN